MTILAYLALGVVGVCLVLVVALLYAIACLMPLFDDPHSKIIARRDARGGTDGR